MLCKCLLSCVLLLAAAGPLLTHPISHSNEMSYTGPVEEDQVMSPKEISLADHAYISHNAPGFGFPSLPERDGLRSAVLGQNQAVREVLLEKPILNPLTRFLGGRTEYRKRTTTECFWKYCV